MGLAAHGPVDVRSLIAGVVLGLLSASVAAAQPRGVEPGTLEAAEGQGGPLVLRPEPGLDEVAEQTARVLSRRSGRPVEIAGPPPGGIADAVPAGQVGLARDDDTVRVVLAGEGAAVATAELTLPDADDAAVARALALAIESLQDAPAPSGASGARGSGAEPVDPARRPANRWGEVPEPDIEPIARPTIYLRLMLGISPLRGQPLVGPGAGLGLCIGPHCLVIEGDLSLVPQEATGQDGAKVRYRSVNASTRLQIRPWTFDDVSVGFTFGMLTRIGNAHLAGTDTNQLVSNFGVRGTLEVAWRFAHPFELVFESGADVAVTRARFIRYEAPIFLEDRWTPWLMAGVRMRP